MKLWIILATVVVFAAGFAVGGATFRASGSGRRPSPGDGPPGYWAGYWDPFGREIFREPCCDKLGLDEAQKLRLEGILSSHSESVREVERTRRALGDKLRSDIEDLLTEPQKALWYQLRKERAEEQRRWSLDREVSELVKELALTPEETAAARSILDWYAREKQVIFETRQPEELRAALDGLRSTRNSKLSEVLPPAKHAKYLEIKESRGKRGGGKTGPRKEFREDKAPPPPQ